MIVLNDDVDDLARWYDATSAQVYGLVLRVVRDPAQAAAVTERVYLQVWRDRAHGDVDTGSSIASVLAIAHGLAVDHARRAGLTDCARTCSAGACSRAWANAAEARAVSRALSGLPAAQRRAIELTYFCGQDSDAAEELLAIRPGTVLDRIRTGLVRLRPSPDRLSPSDT